MANALTKYRQGAQLSASERGSALKQAVKSADSARALAKKAPTKRAMASAGRTAGTVGVAAASAYASGRYGDKMKPGGMDARPVVGLLAIGIGLYQEARGKKGGTVAAAIGDGAITAWACERAYAAGQKAAAGSPAVTAEPAPAIPADTQPASGADELPPVRQILYSPEPVSGSHIVPAQVLQPLDL